MLALFNIFVQSKLYRRDISAPVIKWFSKRVGDEHIDKKDIVSKL